MSLPLKTKVYGGLQFDMDLSTQRSSNPANVMSQMSDAKSFKKGSIMDHANFSTQPHSGLKSLENSRLLSDQKQAFNVAGNRIR